jgi:Co/Zn/Cd efflux system component
VHPITIAFEQATLVAVIGLVVNGACVLILGGNEQVPAERTADPGEHGHHGLHDHNVRSAYRCACRRMLPVRSSVPAHGVGYG